VIGERRLPCLHLFEFKLTQQFKFRYAPHKISRDDQGRYVLPDLPKANYNVWVRVYGLVDSPKVKAVPSKDDIKSIPAIKNKVK
jgi:hypothetical protein